MTRSYLRMPFTYASSVLSETLEQASTVFEDIKYNSSILKLLKIVRYGKVSYFKNASFY